MSDNQSSDTPTPFDAELVFSMLPRRVPAKILRRRRRGRGRVASDGRVRLLIAAVYPDGRPIYDIDCVQTWVRDQIAIVSVYMGYIELTCDFFCAFPVATTYRDQLCLRVAFETGQVCPTEPSTCTDHSDTNFAGHAYTP